MSMILLFCNLRGGMVCAGNSSSSARLKMHSAFPGCAVGCNTTTLISTECGCSVWNKHRRPIASRHPYRSTIQFQRPWHLAPQHDMSMQINSRWTRKTAGNWLVDHCNSSKHVNNTPDSGCNFNTASNISLYDGRSVCLSPVILPSSG